MNPITCDDNNRPQSAERYVTRRMSAAEAEVFEDHFVTCSECQSEVRLASAIVAGLPRAPGAIRSGWGRRVRIWGGGGLALAAGLATLMIFRSAPRSDFVALGAVGEPPMYLGVPVRGDAAAPDSVFEAAMGAYAMRQYAAATAGLRATLAAGHDSVPATFFLATSLLLDAKPREAVEQFRRLLDGGGAPYRAEARYYRAKALLRLGRAAEAEAELQRLTPSDSAIYDMARALADSVGRARAR